MLARIPPSRELWRWYILLLIANELDLAFTYVGLSRGNFMEANPLLAPHLHTWWPVVLKLVPLGALALCIAFILRTGGRQHYALGAIRFATVVYTLVLVVHVLHVLTSLFTG